MAGDATVEADLIRAGIRRAARCIVALDDDARAVFATLMARRLNPDLYILARANTVEAVERLYLAGADTVLSVSGVAGARLARLLTGSEESGLDVDELGLHKVPVPTTLAGSTLVQSRIGARTGCQVVAVQGATGRMELTPPPDHLLRQGDRLLLFGTPEQMERFRSAYGA